MKNTKKMPAPTIASSVQFNQLTQLVKDLGGGLFLVGGIVRDGILGKPSKDIDVVINNIKKDVLYAELQKIGRIQEVGKSFGVSKFVFNNDLEGLGEIDIAFPRKDEPFHGFEVFLPNTKEEGLFLPVGKSNPVFTITEEEFGFMEKTVLDFSKIENFEQIEIHLKNGKFNYKAKKGYTGFRSFVDEFMSIEDDLGRRDITINSIAFDCINMVYVDPFDGVGSIINKEIKMVSPKSFMDDPLRMLRACKFYGRFDGFTFDLETFDAICENASKIKDITFERIRLEIESMFEKGNIYRSLDALTRSGLMSEIFGCELSVPDFIMVKHISEMWFIITQKKGNKDLFKNMHIQEEHRKDVQVLWDWFDLQNQTFLSPLDKLKAEVNFYLVRFVRRADKGYERQISKSSYFPDCLRDAFVSARLNTKQDIQKFNDFPEDLEISKRTKWVEGRVFAEVSKFLTF